MVSVQVHKEMVFEFLDCLVQRKFNMKFFVPKAAYKFCPGFPLLSLVNFFQCTFIAGFRNNFQDHRRVTEQLLETQAAIRKPEPAL
jgi:hypothetical protein